MLMQQQHCWQLRAASAAGSSSARPLAQQQRQQQRRRACACSAKRGRPRKTAEGGDAAALPGEAPLAAPAPAKRKGRPRRADVAPPPTTAQAPLAEEMHASPEHERVVSFELDLTSSMELDYTDNTALIVPSYTHQAQGHESATQPPLDNFVPNFEGSGLIGSEEPAAAAQRQQQPAAAAAPPPPAWPAGQQEQPQLLQQVQALQVAALQQQQQQQQAQGDAGLQVMPVPQLVGAGLSGAPEDEEDEEEEEEGADADEDEDLGVEEPPGLFDYEAGLAFATTQPEPERPLQLLPANMVPRSRREADYLIRYINWLGYFERERRQEEYEERALEYHLAARKESHNVYLTGKAMSVVMAEIELEDTQTSNRTDSFYPVWARAEHRWYPSGRFAAYNAYIKDNLPELTMKYAPGADQEEDFDIMDDVLLMANDPAAPGGADDGGDDEAGGGGGPAAGLSLDSFMGAGLLPGAGASELGQAYLDDVLAPGAGEEEELVAEEE